MPEAERLGRQLATGALDMYRHRGRTVGTFIIGAILVVALIYAAFGRSGSSTMLTPHVKAQIGAVEGSLRSKPALAS